MIIEIALGIVVAVLILSFLDVILGFAMIAVLIAVVLAIVAAVIYFAFAEPIATAIFAGIAALIGGAVYWDDKQRYKKPPPLDPTESAITDSKPIDRSIPIEALWLRELWLRLSPGNKTIVIGGSAVVLVVATCGYVYWIVRKHTWTDLLFVLAAVLVSVAGAFVIFGPLFFLDWLRARKKARIAAKNAQSGTHNSDRADIIAK